MYRTLWTDRRMGNIRLCAKFEMRSSLHSDAIVITTDGQTDGQTDGRTDEQKDIAQMF